MKLYQETATPIAFVPSTLERVWQAAGQAVDRLTSELKSSCDVTLRFSDAREALGRLPISQSEFALATRRLDNAEDYYGRGELGAAKYELNLLNGMICRDAKCVKTLRRTKSLY